MTRQEVYNSIDSERDYQIVKWGGYIHDKKHNLSDWILFIERHLNNAKVSNYDYDTLENILDEFRKIAAMCVAVGELYGLPKR